MARAFLDWPLPARRRWPGHLLLLFLVALFLLFFATHATLHLAADDVAWLSR